MVEKYHYFPQFWFLLLIRIFQLIFEPKRFEFGDESSHQIYSVCIRGLIRPIIVMRLSDHSSSDIQLIAVVV